MNMKNIFLNKTFINALILVLMYAIVQSLIIVGVVDGFILATIATICINIILAVSLNLITGFTGQFSLGHAGFMSIGAYVCAIITLRYPTLFGFIIGIVSGAISAAIIGALIGLPTLRLRGDYLAIATLGLAEIIRILFLNLKITNGAAGLIGIPNFTNWTSLYILTVGTVIVISNFIRSSHGRACISVREDEIAAESIGINTTNYKTLAFTMGAFFAGVAGALYASFFFFLKPGLFGFAKSIDILVIIVFGGLGSISGSILAAVALALISTFLQSFSEIRMIVYSLLLVAIMLFRPQGIMGSKEISLNILKKFGNNLFGRKGGVR